MLKDFHLRAGILLKKLWSALLNLLPIMGVVIFFQFVVLRQPFPMVGDILVGGLLVVAGLMLFIEGLEMGLFPIGEAMAFALARKGSLFWLVVFAFALGFSTTVAEPALIAVAGQAAKTFAESGLIENEKTARADYALGIRLSVAVSVGLSIVVGVLRILKGWPVQFVIIGGYLAVMVMTLFAPKEIIGLAYDSGAITTSTITVPLVMALGVGLANVIRGRNALLDGFGLIALASLMPMIFVMGFGIFVFGIK
jgi:hypothetical protein